MGYTLDVSASIKIYRNDNERANLKRAIDKTNSEPDFLDEVKSFDVVSKEKKFYLNDDKFSILRENLDFYYHFVGTGVEGSQDVASLLGSIKRFYGIDFHSKSFVGIPLEDMVEIIQSMVLEGEDADIDCLRELKEHLLGFIENVVKSLSDFNVERYEINFRVSIV